MDAKRSGRPVVATPEPSLPHGRKSVSTSTPRHLGLAQGWRLLRWIVVILCVALPYLPPEQPFFPLPICRTGLGKIDRSTVECQRRKGGFWYGWASGAYRGCWITCDWPVILEQIRPEHISAMATTVKVDPRGILEPLLMPIFGIPAKRERAGSRVAPEP